ncbi:bifunctional folylpolyglutamate synthase/dihydrofolate synthase [Pontixanthobacter aquaemixtae]|uniref:Bifunctional folylpolyglutamate synthase/dihydrofolate synthase n=1 Tax=Pontixanthobacter aquaemixtae TaxID=1958940 RepID=A0A844ZRR3_9SPHN|nr:folylpolyglutamate synthase/dihydrofolate synthase family protein [Pontixanthobacter aquaemixtae]MXO90543.1 bifunctional folylpolyglutamate synthase/dihydrofolate synthase [Pontixanthobacter aquaemixtae]
MKDFGTSSDPAVQGQLDRLAALSLPEGRLGLETMRDVLARLGNPQDRLPPVFHVAGTNGKGSACAFLRATLEADGKTVHVTTSPHLVRYNERIRVAGKLIEDARLAQLLEEVLDAADGLNPSFFEVTIAAAFTEFARVPADACVVEVGLGGRFDATNVLRPEVLAACGIAELGIDHERFLLAPEDGVPTQPLARIAFEKAGIAKEGVPLVSLGQWLHPDSQIAIGEVADSIGAPLFELGDAWNVYSSDEGLSYFDEGDDIYFAGKLALHGEHQAINAGLAIAMLRHQSALKIADDAIVKGLQSAKWPARLQRLSAGPVTSLSPGLPVWLDGGHNPNAGAAIAEFFPQDIHLVLGMLDNKNPQAFLDPMGDRIRSLTVVPVPAHDSHPATAFGPDARAASDVEEALLNLPADDYPVLIAGSLYLAGEVLRLNNELPD